MRVLIIVIVVIALGFAVLRIVNPRQGSSVNVANVTELDSVPNVENTEVVPKADVEIDAVVENSFMEFDNTPLSEAVREFNRRNAIQIELAEPSIGETLISASLRSDNPDAFVNLLELVFDLRVEEVDASTIRLHREE